MRTRTKKPARPRLYHANTRCAYAKNACNKTDRGSLRRARRNTTTSDARSARISTTPTVLELCFVLTRQTMVPTVATKTAFASSAPFDWTCASPPRPPSRGTPAVSRAAPLRRRPARAASARAAPSPTLVHVHRLHQQHTVRAGAARNRRRLRLAALPFSNARETCERARCESSRRPTGIHATHACPPRVATPRAPPDEPVPSHHRSRPRTRHLGSRFCRIEAAPAPVPANASLGRIPRVDAACTARRHRRADAPFAGTRVASPGRRARAARAKRVSPLSRVFADRALPLMSRPPRLLPRSLLSQSP